MQIVTQSSKFPWRSVIVSLYFFFGFELVESMANGLMRLVCLNSPSALPCCSSKVEIPANETRGGDGVTLASGLPDEYPNKVVECVSIVASESLSSL